MIHVLIFQKNMKIYKIAENIPYRINILKDKTVRVKTNRQCTICQKDYPQQSIMRNITLEVMKSEDDDYPKFENLYFCDNCGSDKVQSYIEGRQSQTIEHSLPKLSTEEEISLQDETDQAIQDAFDKNIDFFRGEGPFKS